MRTFLPHGRRRSRLAVSLLAVPLALLTACGGGQSDGPHLELTAALPDDVPDGTVLRIGDPATQMALELSGLDRRSSTFEVEWANISGGPQTTGGVPGQRPGRRLRSRTSRRSTRTWTGTGREDRRRHASARTR